MVKEIVSLYGRVTDAWMKNKICQIAGSAAALEDSLTQEK